MREEEKKQQTGRKMFKVSSRRMHNEKHFKYAKTSKIKNEIEFRNEMEERYSESERASERERCKQAKEVILISTHSTYYSRLAVYGILTYIYFANLCFVIIDSTKTIERTKRKKNEEKKNIV